MAAANLLSACGRSVIPALLAFPLAYNLSLHYGFISFALSLPALLLLLAAFARYLTDLQAGWRRLVVLAALAVVLFLCHLQNFLFGLCAALAFQPVLRGALATPLPSSGRAGTGGVSDDSLADDPPVRTRGGGSQPHGHLEHTVAGAPERSRFAQPLG